MLDGTSILIKKYRCAGMMPREVFDRDSLSSFLILLITVKLLSSSALTKLSTGTTISIRGSNTSHMLLDRWTSNSVSCMTINYSYEYKFDCNTEKVQIFDIQQ